MADDFPDQRTRALLPKRFWSRLVLDAETGCWLWPGADNGHGYGIINWGGHQQITYTHRLAYELLVGPIPDGLHLDHVCRVRRCCNPAHLEPVTAAENVRRARRDECRHGHPYTPENTYEFRGKRYCRACRRKNARAAHDRARPDHARYLLTPDGEVDRAHCMRGHPWTPESTGRSRNGRYCKICHAERGRENAARRRASKER